MLILARQRHSTLTASQYSLKSRPRPAMTLQNKSFGAADNKKIEGSVRYLILTGSQPHFLAGQPPC